MICRTLAGVLIAFFLWAMPGIVAGEKGSDSAEAFFAAGSNQQSATSEPGSAQKSSESKESPAHEQQPAAGMHSIVLQFDYDFTKTPACSEKVKKSCVQQFVAYDISGEKPYYLFSFPVPEDAQGIMKGIKATSPRLLFAVGKHRIGVSARMPDGKESPPRDCKTIIDIRN